MLRATVRIEVKKKSGKGSKGLNAAAAEVIEAATRKAFEQHSGELRSALQETPKKINRSEWEALGLQWTSDRQAVAYVYSKGFGRGIPTARTGQLAEGWQVELLGRGDGVRGKYTKSSGGSPYNASIRVMNTVSYAKWVQGSFDRRRYTVPQQSFHIGIGWPNAYETTAEYFTKMQTEIENYIVLNSAEALSQAVIKLFSR